jgi:hypothetical protein
VSILKRQARRSVEKDRKKRLTKETKVDTRTFGIKEKEDYVIQPWRRRKTISAEAFGRDPFDNFY